MEQILLVTMALASLTVFVPQKASSQNDDELTMLVGTYTNGSSTGIYTYRFNETTGKSSILDSMTVDNPSYLVLSKDEKHVYAVSELSDATARVNAYSFNKETGKLHFLNDQQTKGADPCYISTNGQIVLTANYSGGSMSVFPINKDGSLAAADTLFQGSTGGPDLSRQNTPHVHCATFSPDGKYIFATDFSADRILHFTVSKQGTLSQLLGEKIMIDADSGPRHLTFSPNGKFAYLISELSGNITVFSYANGKLTKMQVIAADTLQARGSADIHLSGDGKFLYASNRLKGDGIAIFKVNEKTGTLSKVGYQLTGIHPRNFNITPNGKFLLVACRDSDIIQVFRRNTATGLLTDTKQNIVLSKPVCIQFAK